MQESTCQTQLRGLTALTARVAPYDGSERGNTWVVTSYLASRGLEGAEDGASGARRERASVLPGDPTDKTGNRYEGWWTLGRVAEVMHGETASIRLEPPGPEGEGVEFWLRHAGTVRYEQVKIQHGAEGRWSLGDLNSRGVLRSFAGKLQDPQVRCVFASSDSAPQLEELTERARGAASYWCSRRV
jgi:hypothetical protein